MSPIGTMFVQEGAERSVSWRQTVRTEVIAASVGIQVQRYPMFARFVAVVAEMQFYAQVALLYQMEAGTMALVGGQVETEEGVAVSVVAASQSIPLVLPHLADEENRLM